MAKLNCFKRMFHAEVPQEKCVCSGCGQSSQSSGWLESGLDGLPAVLVGVVRVEEGGLALADSTGYVLCEVCIRL